MRSRHQRHVSAPPAQPNRTPLLLLAGIVAVCAITAIVHSPSLSCKALSLDDQAYLIDNPIMEHLNWTNARRVCTEVTKPTAIAGSYIPLALLSHMLDSAMGGSAANLSPYHRTSFLLHLGATALVAVILYQLFGGTAPALLAALLFGLHPLTVGRIVWTADRKTVLSAFFALSSLVAYIRSVRRQSRRSLYWSLLLYVCALLSKPTALPIPAAMLLLDYWPLRRLNGKALLEKLPFFALGTAFFVISYLSFTNTIPLTSMGAPGFWRIPKTLCHNIVFDLYKIFYPSNLSVFYPFPDPLSLANPMVLAGVIAAPIVLATLVFSWRYTRALVTGFLMFFALIFPTLGVIGFTDAATDDRFIYLPAIGLLVTLDYYLSRLWASGRRARAATLSVIAALAVAEASASRSYLKCWTDTDTHYRHVIALAPAIAKLNHDYATLLARQGRDDLAIEYFTRTLRLDPRFGAARNHLGILFARRGRLDDAITQFRDALAINPALPTEQHNLAQTLYIKKDLRGAIEHFSKAIELKPDAPSSLAGLAWIFATSNDPRLLDGARAVSLASRACQLTEFLNPAFLDALGAAYARSGDFPSAIKTATSALALTRAPDTQSLAEGISARLRLYDTRTPFTQN